MFHRVELTIPFLRSVSIVLPIAAINTILSLLPTMVRRFNTPALPKLYRRNLVREQKELSVSDAQRG